MVSVEEWYNLREVIADDVGRGNRHYRQGTDATEDV